MINSYVPIYWLTVGSDNIVILIVYQSAIGMTIIVLKCRCLNFGSKNIDQDQGVPANMDKTLANNSQSLQMFMLMVLFKDQSQKTWLPIYCGIQDANVFKPKQCQA
jgi:hypothetical protein